MVRARLHKAAGLKVDIDCVVSRDWLQNWIRIVVIPTCKAFGVTVVSVAVGPSQHKGYHAYIDITPSVHPELANQLQFLVGDDRHRVSLNRARMRAGLDQWNKLFEDPNIKLTVIYGRAHYLTLGEFVAISRGRRFRSIRAPHYARTNH